MPLQNKEAYKSYMNTYMKQRYEKRRHKAIENLGGECSRCGSTNELEFDHKDPSTKTMSVARASSLSNQRWNEEIAKCQLLCNSCHKAKTKEDRERSTMEETP
jgi:5-methylcytosine-specific restriction endonuclease McrA